MRPAALGGLGSDGGEARDELLGAVADVLGDLERRQGVDELAPAFPAARICLSCSGTDADISVMPTT